MGATVSIDQAKVVADPWVCQFPAASLAMTEIVCGPSTKPLAVMGVLTDVSALYEPLSSL